MNCDRFNEILHDYLDGALDEVREALAAEHVAACPACAREARAFRRTRELAKQYGPELAPEGFEAAVREKIEAELRARRARERRAGSRAFPFRVGPAPRWAALAATFALVILAGAYFKIFYLGPGANLKVSEYAKNSKAADTFTAKEKQTLEKRNSVPVMVRREQAAAPTETARDEKTVSGESGFDRTETARAEREAAHPNLDSIAGGGSAAGLVAAPRPINPPAAAPAGPRSSALKAIDAESVAPTTEEAAAFENAVVNYEMKQALAGAAGPREADAPASAKDVGAEQQPAVAVESKSGESAERKGRVASAKKEAVALSASADEAPAPAAAELAEYNVGGRGGGGYFAPSAMPFMYDATFEGAAPAKPASPGGVVIVRATDVINTTNPAATFQKCLNMINDFVKANPVAGALWRRDADRFIVRGPYKTLLTLREKLAAEFNSRKPVAAAPAKPAAKAKAKAESAPDFASGTPAVLDIYISRMKTPPAAAPAATPADGIK